MKIDFTNVNANPFAEAGVKAQAHANYTEARNTQVSGAGYKLDISGIVKDNAAFNGYNDQGKSIEECVQEVAGSGISALDMSVQRDYYAVMSNSLSAEDFGKLNKDGYDLSDMTAKEMVTVVDQIKVRLAQSGTVIEGYNDSLDVDKIKEVIGNELSARAIDREQQIKTTLEQNDLPVTARNMQQAKEALSMADELAVSSEDGRISDNAARYIIENQKTPTLFNFYEAQYKGQNMPVLPLSEENLEELHEQISNVIADAGFEADENKLADAKWIIEHQLPLTKDTLKQFEEIKNIELPVKDEELLGAVADAISFGLKGTDALLIRDRRVFAEARLAMTTEANLKLLKSGFSIDTSDLEKQVEELKKEEEAISNSNNIDVTTAIKNKVDEIKTLPAAVIGELSIRSAYDLNDVYEKGSAWKAKYDLAQMTYEAVGTKVTRDLGDSLSKAFANADSLMDELNIPKSEENRRAVRILGYNQMEITEDNLEKVKTADAQLNHCLNALKPGAVLKLIRNGMNPLEMSVSELKIQLDKLNTDDVKDQKYSEFLWKLEKNNEITKEEKDSYIGIYRLFRQVEKTDGAVLGSLVNQNADLSVKNLLSAVRSRKARGIDFEINDDFGGLGTVSNTETMTISDQIGQAFTTREYLKDKLKDTLSSMDASKLHKMNSEGRLSDETTLQDLYDEMILTDSEDSEIDEAYNKEMASRIRESMMAEEDVITALENTSNEPTLDNMRAMYSLLFGRGDLFKHLKNIGKGINTAELIESFESKDEAAKAMEELCEESLDEIKAAMDKQDVSHSNIEELRLMSKQISLVSSMSRQESYEVPMEIDGELTAVNVKLVHGDETGSVLATMELDEYGPLSIQINLADNNINGYMLSKTRNGEDYLKEMEAELIAAFENAGFDIEMGLPVMRSAELNPVKNIISTQDNSDKVDTRQLYNVAKIFLQTIGGNK